jgi:ATP/maltotriose-dependent transcriptional regulator MalT
MLVNEIAGLVQPLALVLDDYHLLQNRAAHEVLRALVERLPPKVHWWSRAAKTRRCR